MFTLYATSIYTEITEIREVLFNDHTWLTNKTQFDRLNTCREEAQWKKG